MKKLKNRIRSIKSGLQNLKEAICNTYASQLYGQPPGPGVEGKTANVDALEKINKITNR